MPQGTLPLIYAIGLDAKLADSKTKFSYDQGRKECSKNMLRPVAASTGRQC